jgi:hypothetical protein
VYVDALVLRDRDTNGDGTLDERRWVVQDANYNVTALFDNSGNVVERYVYDPFGSVTVLDANWERPGGSPSPGSTCTRAAGSTARAACTTSGTATTRRPSAAGPASTRCATTRATPTSTGR